MGSSFKYTHEMVFQLGPSELKSVQTLLRGSSTRIERPNTVGRTYIDDDLYSIARRHWKLEKRVFRNDPKRNDTPTWKLTHRPGATQYAEVCDDERDIIRILELPLAGLLHSTLDRAGIGIRAVARGQRQFYGLGETAATLTDYSIELRNGYPSTLSYPHILEISTRGNSREEMEKNISRMRQLSATLGLTNQVPGWTLHAANISIRKLGLDRHLAVA